MGEQTEPTAGRVELEAWMDRSHMSPTETANAFGITVQHLSQIRHGARTPTLVTAIVIKQRTGIGVEAWVPDPIGALDRRRKARMIKCGVANTLTDRAVG